VNEIKNNVEVEYIRQACTIVGELLLYLKDIAKPGVSTKLLDEHAENFTRKKGGIPAFKHYNGFPSSICTSVNEEVIHGIPSGYLLKEGDILSVDVGVNKSGYFGDAAVTIPIGQISKEKMRLLKTTEEALYAGIEKAVDGNHVSDISKAVQMVVEREGFSVVRDFVGHGVGRKLHEDPPIPNFKTPGRGPKLHSGMTIAIEPMVNAGSYDVVVTDDNWTVITKDRMPSAHFEHTILVREETAEILTMV